TLGPAKLLAGRRPAVTRTPPPPRPADNSLWSGSIPRRALSRLACGPTDRAAGPRCALFPPCPPRISLLSRAVPASPPASVLRAPALLPPGCLLYLSPGFGLRFLPTLSRPAARHGCAAPRKAQPACAKRRAPSWQLLPRRPLQFAALQMRACS